MKLVYPAPELAEFSAEPKQLPSGSLGKNAFLKLGFERRGAKTALVTIDRRAPLLVQQALYFDECMPGLACVYIISNSGGILQGDRYAIEIVLAPETQAHITTQAATKVHEMDTNYATQMQAITLGAGSYLEYLPGAVIPHRGSRFVSQTVISIDPSATLLYSEILMAGRKYYGTGELFEYELFSSTVRAERPDHASLFTERFVIEPRNIDVRQTGVMDRFDVFGNVLLLTPRVHADRIFDAVQPVAGADSDHVAAVSRLPENAGLVYKILGFESQVVRAKIRDFWSVARQECAGAQVPAEFLWG